MLVQPRPFESKLLSPIARAQNTNTPFRLLSSPPPNFFLAFHILHVSIHFLKQKKKSMIFTVALICIKRILLSLQDFF
jgi:hypothetical protein